MVLSRREHKGIDLVSENHVQELSQVRFLIRSGVLARANAVVRTLPNVVETIMAILNEEETSSVEDCKTPP